MRMRTAGIAGVLALLTFPVAALARWSEPRTYAVPGAAGAAIAVNGRGEVAVGWIRSSAPPSLRTSVHVAVRTAGGQFRRHRVWSSRRLGASHPAVALDRRGTVTVTWDSGTPRTRRQTVFAAYGPAAGRWARARVVGHGPPFQPVVPRLAVAPDGRVLLAFDGALAWRSPGHRFGAARAVTRPLGPVPVFDADGAAYLYGNCDGAVRRTRPDRRRFGRPIRPATGSALGFSLSVTGDGRGLASWVDGRCSTDIAGGITTGRVFASVLRNGRFGAPIALPSANDASGTNALAVRSGGGTVSWAQLGSGAPAGIQPAAGVFTVPIGAGGTVGPVRRHADGVVPYLADGRGDQLHTRVFPGPADPFGRGDVTFVRPVRGPDERAPASFVQPAVTPFGRAAAVVWSPRPGHLALSVWRP